MPQVLWSVGLLVNFHLVAAASNNSPMPSTRPAPGCPSMCGDVEIPYPFGISDCAWPGPDNFTVICDHSSNPPRLFFSNAEVTNISLVNGSMTVFTPVSSLCYTSSNTTDPGKGGYGLKLTNTSFLISATENVFTAIGCNRLALVYGKQDASYFAGCVTSCRSLDTADLPYDGDTCSGVGCCQTTILSNLSTILVDWNYGNNGTTPNNPWWNYLPCMYAFVGQKDWYKFHMIDLIGTGNDTFANRVDRTIPLVLDWAIRDGGICRKLPSKDDGVSAESTASACVSPKASLSRSFT